MKVEITIREILRENTPEIAAEKICQFMDWDKQKLLNAIRTYGTTEPKRISAIISVFWNRENLRGDKK